MNKSSLFILALILIGAFLRFYNLNWGAPFYFHPDERNIATAVTQLSFPSQMNPHFFAYGSLPIYVIYLTGLITNFFSSCKLLMVNCEVSFSQAILISRFYSAVFSTLLIPLFFLIGKKIKDEKLGILAAFLATTSVGFIQFAHFGTFEMWLTFFTALLFWLCLQITEKNKNKIILLLGATFGILVAVKISSLALLPIPLLTIFLASRSKISNSFKAFFSFIIFSFFVYAITNPYAFFDYSSFVLSLKYESGVVTNALNAFYTGGFYNTVPVLFQFLHIYPFLLNPLLTIIFIPAFFYVLYKGIKAKNRPFLILTYYFLLLFLSQAFLFAKWTRYMVPTLPFIYLIISVALLDFLQRFKKVLRIKYLVLSILLSTSALFATSYFITVFAQLDTRTEASKFAKKNIPQKANVLTEPYDLGITPFNSQLLNISFFSFYDLDSNNTALEQELETKLAKAQYIILPSQRLLRSRLLNSQKFPKSHSFYSLLVNEAVGFQKIYQTPCSLACKITYLNNPVFGFEETASVFDRPTVMIFEEIKR